MLSHCVIVRGTLFLLNRPLLAFFFPRVALQRYKVEKKNQIIARWNIADRTVLHTEGMFGSILQTTSLSSSACLAFLRRSLLK
jgi:hypothetical protein